MKSLYTQSPEFKRLVEGEPDICVARVALEISRDARPTLDIEAYLRRIGDLTRRVRERCGPKARPRGIVGHVNWVLFVEEGFRGNKDDYYDPRNSYLDEVLDRKSGIPISLSILFSAVASPLGVELAGVSLPGHYLLRLIGEKPPIFVDAFQSGRLLTREGASQRVAEAIGRELVLDDEAIAPCTSVETVRRMLRNLKATYIRDDDLMAALPVVRRLGVLEPRNRDGQRDWGVIAYQTGHPGEAITPLERYLELNSTAKDAPAIAEIVRSARREVSANN